MNIELAKRAVACKHWRWMPGMPSTIGKIVSGESWPNIVAALEAAP